MRIFNEILEHSIDYYSKISADFNSFFSHGLIGEALSSVNSYVPPAITSLLSEHPIPLIIAALAIGVGIIMKTARLVLISIGGIAMIYILEGGGF